MRRLLWLIVLIVIVAGGLILFFFWEDSTPRWKPKSAVLVEKQGDIFDQIGSQEESALVDLGPAPTSPIIRIVFFACLALIAVGAILVLYRLWRYYCALTRTGKYLCMVWLIIIAFVLIGLFPPVYNPELSARALRGTGQRQNSFAFLFYMPHGYRINYRTLLVEWAIVIAIPVGVIITLRIKNKPSQQA